LTSIVLALSAALSWGVSDFLGGLVSRRVSIASLLTISHLVGFLGFLGVALITREPLPEAHYLWRATVTSLLALIGIVAFFRGMVVGRMSVVAPLSATGSIVPVVAGLAMGEQASAWQILGIALALLGIVVVSRATTTDQGPSGASSVGYALLAAAAFGLFFLLVRWSSEASVIWSLVVMRGTSLTLLILYALVRRHDFTMPPRLLGTILVQGSIEGAANVFFAFATQTGLVSVVAVLASLFPVVTTVLARLFLSERLSRSQQAGVVSALAGVILISAH